MCAALPDGAFQKGYVEMKGNEIRGIKAKPIDFDMNLFRQINSDVQSAMIMNDCAFSMRCIKSFECF